MSEALEKIQAIFKESKNFALFSKPSSEDYKLLAKEALKSALLEKKLGVFSLPEIPEFQKKWALALLKEETIFSPQKTSIRIPKNQYKVKELSYEEDDNFLSLIMTSENGGLDKNSIIIEPILAKANAVFCFFDPHDAEILQQIGTKIIMPPKERIIFLTSGEKTFAEKTFQIIKAVFPDFIMSPKIATLLFAALITETNNFVRPASQEVFHFGSELLTAGADKELVKNILNGEKTISFARLLGRALARTHIDNNLGASWTFLTQEDFKKTDNFNVSLSFLHNIIRNLRELIPFHNLSLLFWQNTGQIESTPINTSLADESRRANPGGPASTSASLGGQNVLAMAVADEEKNLAPLAQQLGVNTQSKFFIAGPFNNFSEAELRFRKAIEETVSLKI